MNFGIDKDTSKYMFLVCFLDLKFAQRIARHGGELQIQHTRRDYGGGNDASSRASDRRPDGVGARACGIRIFIPRHGVAL